MAKKMPGSRHHGGGHRGGRGYGGYGRGYGGYGRGYNRYYPGAYGRAYGSFYYPYGPIGYPYAPYYPGAYTYPYLGYGAPTYQYKEKIKYTAKGEAPEQVVVQPVVKQPVTVVEPTVTTPNVTVISTPSIGETVDLDPAVITTNGVRTVVTSTNVTRNWIILGVGALLLVLIASGIAMVNK